MSLKRKIISTIISTFAVVSFTTFVSAQNTGTTTTTQEQDSANQQQRQRRDRRGGGGNRNGFGRESRRDGMMRDFAKFNLTDAQKEQIRTIMETNRPDRNSFEEVRGLMEAKRNGTITAEQTEKLNVFREQQKQKHEQVKTQILGVLTAEQLVELEKIKAERKQKREERQKMRQERRNQQQNQQDDTDN